MEEQKAMLGSLLIGQEEAIEQIWPFVEIYHAGLSQPGRPVGIFLLCGPTGCGKTRTVEALAETLHGSPKKMLRIDCGEFYDAHEAAKLIGPPPGYLGHGDTHGLLAQDAINNTISEKCNLSLLLLDEVEKAHVGIHRVLLGILDKASLRMGNNRATDFQNTMVFMTTNLGAREMQRELAGYGFERPASDSNRKHGVTAAKKKFTPELMNRIDRTIEYKRLTADNIKAILEAELGNLSKLILARMGLRAFTVSCSPEAKAELLKRGWSEEYGARELKRVVFRDIYTALALMINAREIPPLASVLVDFDRGNFTFDVAITKRRGVIK
jgi:ATP-dependent Clp protease ATP-binding subunit ClpA